jgi:hypothetical protein
MTYSLHANHALQTKHIHSSSINSGTAKNVSKVSMIITTQPSLFTPRFAQEIGFTVLILDSSEAVFSNLKTQNCGAIFADYRQLNDHWTGQKFLRYVRDHHEYDSIDFWLMAEHWHESQHDWALKCGAAGMIRRTPDAVAVRILHAPPSFENELLEVDYNFERFSDSDVAPLHIQAARAALHSGLIENNKTAYIQELSSRISGWDRRNGFVDSTQDQGNTKPSFDMTKTGDPWMDEVNYLFKVFAGALGARLMIAQSFTALESSGSYEKSFYLNDLAARLASPERRAEFLLAVREKNL